MRISEHSRWSSVADLEFDAPVGCLGGKAPVGWNHGARPAHRTQLELARVEVAAVEQPIVNRECASLAQPKLFALISRSIGVHFDHDPAFWLEPKQVRDSSEIEVP